MGIVLWIVLFLVLSGICVWVVFGDGVETVAGLVAATLLGSGGLQGLQRPSCCRKMAMVRRGSDRENFQNAASN